MIEILPSSAFRKAFKRKVRGNKILGTRFRERVAIFQRDPFDARLKTHRLSGQMQGLWSFSIDYDARVVFSFVDTTRVLFIDIGTRDEVY